MRHYRPFVPFSHALQTDIKPAVCAAPCLPWRGPFRLWGCLPWKAPVISGVMPFTANACSADHHLAHSVGRSTTAAYSCASALKRQAYCPYLIHSMQELTTRNTCIVTGTADVRGELGTSPTSRRAQGAYPLRRASPWYADMSTVRNLSEHLACKWMCCL